MFPINMNLNLTSEAREREPFKINVGRTNAYKISAIPFCQRLLNANLREEEQKPNGNSFKKTFLNKLKTLC
jgi:hypothetical protein